MRVAIIGSGISGLGAAIALHGQPGVEVTLYERDARLGGHAHTMDVDYDGVPIAVDTGFIVYNELNYPNFTALLQWAGVETIRSDMSFALSCGNGRFEWSGRNSSVLGGLFAQKRNVFDPGFYRFLLGIFQFQARALADNRTGVIGNETLAEYLAGIGVHDRVRDDYVVPMAAAIWSMTPGETLRFPACSFMAFFNNHKLLHWNRPVWRTVKGGSRNYLNRLSAYLGDAARRGDGVVSIRPLGNSVIVRDMKGTDHAYHAVIIATHAPTALSLLAEPDARTRDILRSFRVSRNRVIVHRDTSLMPKRRRAWASWNLIRRDSAGTAAVTYWMNRLQKLPEDRPIFVTLNPDRPVRSDKIFATLGYDHPIYDAAAIAAQKELDSIQGRGNIYFAGAWTGYGFHEDGLRSGLAAAARLGGVPPWKR